MQGEAAASELVFHNARADAAVVGDDGVDDRDVALVAAHAVDDLHLDELVGRERLGLGDAAGGVQPDRHADDRRLAHLGKALLVPVDSPAIGIRLPSATSSRATARCVPSPPRTTIADTPARTSCRVAVNVSSTVDSGSMSRNSTSGNPRGRHGRPHRRPAPVLVVVVLAFGWRSSSARMPPRSGITSARWTPQTAALLKTRAARCSPGR